MATHDYVIDNATGAVVRGDINNVLKAILTNNSGTTDPATVISSDAGNKAFSFWADTSSSPAVLKIRNAADNDWIELFQLDGTLTLEDGSASTPALAFRDDLNTGIFSSEADSLNVATGGVERMKLGDITIFNESGADVDFRIEGDTNANLFYLDAGNDRVGIGTNSIDRFVHIEGTDNVLLKLQNNQTVCLMEFQDTDTTSGNRPAMGADGNNAVFYTGGVPTMVIDSAGRVGIGTTSPSRKLVVAGDTNTVVSVTGASDGTSSLFLGDTDDDDVGSISYNHSTEDLTFRTGASQRLSIKSSGAAFAVPIQLGSSNSHDSAKIVLQGSGNTSATNSVYIKNSDETPLFQLRNDGVFFTGTDGNSPYNSTTASAANVFVSSNGALSRGGVSGLKYKKDIKDATWGLAEVLKLKPKTFKSNTTGEFADDKTYAGFIAEDIHDLGLTEFVQYNEANEPDALAYGNMVALMAKAIQELNAKVAALEAA